MNMIEWIVKNKEWIFSGIGVSVLAYLLGSAKKKSGFKLTFQFYAILFVGVVLAFGVDYFLNFSGDSRLRVFLFGTTIIFTFWADKFIQFIKRISAVRASVKKLSIKDCEYVVKCHQKTEYFYFDFTNYSEFQSKWSNILYIPTGKQIVLHEPYKICVYEYAYKLARKRIKGVKNET